MEKPKNQITTITTSPSRYMPDECAERYEHSMCTYWGRGRNKFFLFIRKQLPTV